MTGKEFAEKYLGCRIMYRGGADNGLATIVGYGTAHKSDWFCYSLDSGKGVSWNDRSLYVMLYPCEKFYCLAVDDMERHAYFIEPYIRKPDDCDTCGAKGEEPCLITCPNRN